MQRNNFKRGVRLDRLALARLTPALAWLPFEKPVILFWIITLPILVSRIYLHIDLGSVYLLPLICCFGICLVFNNKWDVLVQTFFSYMTVEGMLKIFSNYNPILHIGADLLALLLITLWLISIRKTGMRGWPPMWQLIIFYSVWVVIMIFHPYAISLFASLAAFKIHLTMLVLIFIGYNHCRTMEQLEKSLLVLVLLGTLISIVGIGQYLQGADAFYSLSPIYYERGTAIGGDFRPWSTTNGPGGVAFGIFIGLAGLLVLLNSQTTSRKQKLIYLLFMILGLVGLALSQARIMMLGVVVGAIVFIAFCGNKVIKQASLTIVMLIAIGGISYYVATSIANERQDDNVPSELYVEGRLQSLFRKDSYELYGGSILETTGEILLNYPFGQGLNRIGPGAGQFYNDGGGPLMPGLYENTITATISELGVPGLLMQLMLFLGTLAPLWAALRRSNHRQYIILCAAVASYLITCWVTSMKGPLFFGGILAAVYWYMLGLGLALTKHLRPIEQPVAVPKRALAPVPAATSTALVSNRANLKSPRSRLLSR